MEWVLEKYAAEFKDKGADFIRETYGVKADDPRRKIATQRAVEKAQEELEGIRSEPADKRGFSLSKLEADKFAERYRDLGPSRLDSSNGSRAATQPISQEQVVALNEAVVNALAKANGRTTSGTCNNNCHCVVA